MSLKETYNMVKEKLLEQGKDVEKELMRVMTEGRVRTKAAGINVLALEVEVERAHTTVDGYYLKKLKDNFGKQKTFIFNKEKGIIQLRNCEKEFDPFTPVLFEKVDSCHNARTKASWLETSDITVMNSTGSPDMKEVIKNAMSADEISEQDYYLVCGTVKFVNAAPIFGKTPGEKPTSSKPIFEQNEKGEKLIIKITIVDQNNKNVNLTVSKLTHLINAYPEKPDENYLSWFEETTDDQRLFELQKGLLGSTLLVMGRGSRYIEKKGEEKEELKKPFLVIGEDGLLFNLERYGVDELFIPPPQNSTTTFPTKPQPQTNFTTPIKQTVPTQSAIVQPTEVKPTINIEAEVLNCIKSGKGTKNDLMVDLPTKLGLRDANPVIQVIKELSAKNEIFREGAGDKGVFRATSSLDDTTTPPVVATPTPAPVTAPVTTPAPVTQTPPQ